MLNNIFADAVYRLLSLGQHRREILPDVYHVFPRLQCNIHTGRPRAVRKTRGVIGLPKGVRVLFLH